MTSQQYLATINDLIARVQAAIEEAQASYVSFVDVRALQAARDAALRNVAALATTYPTASNWPAWSESAEATVSSLRQALQLAGKYSAEGVADQVASNLATNVEAAAEKTGEAVTKGAAVGAGALVLVIGLVILLKVL